MVKSVDIYSKTDRAIATTSLKNVWKKNEKTGNLWNLQIACYLSSNHNKVCSMDDSGKCNPKIPSSCEKGDLIDKEIAHCKVNCKSGPLLPIELRSCRIRKCIPPNNLKQSRIIDVPYYKESSRCDAMKGLPVECGLEQTRCVLWWKAKVSLFHGWL